MSYDDETRGRAAEGRAARMLAGAALIVALTGPLWVPGMLAKLNFQAASDRIAEQNRQDITQLEQAARAAEQRVKAAEAAAAAVRSDLGKLEQRVGAMRDALAGGAAADLARALRGDGPFERELPALRAFLSPPPDVNDMLGAIAPYAVGGVPTTRDLRYRLMKEVQAGPGESAMAWLRRAVTLSAPEPEEPPNPNLLEAAALLRDDDLAGAMAAARRIDPAPAWLATWLKDAAARSSADALLPRLDRLAGTP